MLDGEAGAVAAALTGLGGVAGGLADGVAGGLGGLREVGLGGGGLGTVDHGLLLGLLEMEAVGGLGGALGLSLGLRLGLSRRLGCGGLRGGLGGGGLGLGCLGEGGGGTGGAGAAHGLELLEGLAIERGPGGLLGAVPIAEDIGRLGWELFGEVLGEIEEGELAVALLEDVGGVDEAGLVEEDLRAVEEEPADGEPDDDGDVDRLAEAGAGALVVDLVEQVDELVGFEGGVASEAVAGARGRWRCRVGWGFEGRHREVCY